MPAVAMRASDGEKESLPFFDHALELDPNFAPALCHPRSSRPGSPVRSRFRAARQTPKCTLWLADQNLPQAEKQVGYFYQCGYGVKQDYAQAHAWYLRAAGHGNSDAENLRRPSEPA
jgi:TPR repeat protein